FTARQLSFAAEQSSFSAKMMGDQIIRSDRPTLLGRIQNTLGDEKVSSEMRAFCELCEEANLEPLVTMSNSELISLSDNCKKGIAQCEYHLVFVLSIRLP